MMGLRLDPRNPAFAGVGSAERLQAAIDRAAWADERGCVTVSVSEHHASEDGYLRALIVSAAALAAQTKHTGIGIADLVAPFSDPLPLAEDPDAAGSELLAHVAHEKNADGAWLDEAGLSGSYEPMPDDELQRSGRYRVLTPEDSRPSSRGWGSSPGRS